MRLQRHQKGPLNCLHQSPLQGLPGPFINQEIDVLSPTISTARGHNWALDNRIALKFANILATLLSKRGLNFRVMGQFYSIPHGFETSPDLMVRRLAVKWTEARLINHYSDVIMGEMASQITSLTIVYSAVCSGANQRKHQSSASLAFVLRIHRWPVNSQHNWPVTRTRKMFPFDDFIMKPFNHLCVGCVQTA